MEHGKRIELYSPSNLLLLATIASGTAAINLIICITIACFLELAVLERLVWNCLNLDLKVVEREGRVIEVGLLRLSFRPGRKHVVSVGRLRLRRDLMNWSVVGQAITSLV